MSDETPQSNLPVGIASAGGGTLLVLLANNLPDTSPWKSWLVLVAPSASVLIGGLFFWIRQKIAEHLKKKGLDAAIAEAKGTLETALRNEATTEEHKATLREELEKLERLAIASRMKRVEALAG